nr:hypothetical protein Iba_chr07aCG4600 [Ipomoea batatas]
MLEAAHLNRSITKDECNVLAEVGLDDADEPAEPNVQYPTKTSREVDESVQVPVQDSDEGFAESDGRNRQSAGQIDIDEELAVQMEVEEEYPMADLTRCLGITEVPMMELFDLAAKVYASKLSAKEAAKGKEKVVDDNEP